MASRSARFMNGPAVQNSGHVSIPRAEYDGLVGLAKRFANLRQNLLNGGVDDQTIDLLTRNAAQPYPKTAVPAAASASDRFTPVNFRFSDNVSTYTTSSYTRNRHSFTHDSHESSDQTDWADGEAFPDDNAMSTDGTPDSQSERSDPQIGYAQQRHSFERNSTRSIQIGNLSEGITHADITSVVRGGQLLELYIRNRDRLATISFLHAADAKAFYEHVRKNDLYIKNKRVEVAWNDRQFTLPDHVAQKVAFGATRNLVLRHRDPNLTEENIRDDLDHIHNLVVIKVDFVNDNCLISTNSVANAMYARTCMMSRLKYKGCRIEWAADECAQSLDQMPVRHHPIPYQSPAKKAINPMANRFELLNLYD